MDSGWANPSSEPPDRGARLLFNMFDAMRCLAIEFTDLATNHPHALVGPGVDPSGVTQLSSSQTPEVTALSGMAPSAS